MELGQNLLLERYRLYGEDFYKPQMMLNDMSFKELSEYITAFCAISYNKLFYEKVNYEIRKDIEKQLIKEINCRLDKIGLLEIFDYVYSTRRSREDFFAYNGDARYELCNIDFNSNESKQVLLKSIEIKQLLDKNNITLDLYKIINNDKLHVSVKDKDSSIIENVLKNS